MVLIGDVNFAKLLDDLSAHGWSYYRIGKHVGCHRVEVVRNWIRLEPRYSHAVALIRLHETVTTSSNTFHMEPTVPVAS